VAVIALGHVTTTVLVPAKSPVQMIAILDVQAVVVRRAQAPVQELLKGKSKFQRLQEVLAGTNMWI